MSGVQAVYEKSLGRFGLEVNDSSDSKRKLVAWSKSSLPVERTASSHDRSPLINIPVPSVRFLKYAATEHLDKIWANSPSDLVCLALGETTSGAKSATELFEYLTSQPHPLEVKDAGEVLKVLKRLDSEGLVKGKVTTKSGPTNTTKYALTGVFDPCLPDDYLWLLSYSLPVSKTKKSRSPEPKEASARKKNTTRMIAVENAPLVEVSVVEYFQLELRGEKAREPEGYLQWLRDPWSAVEDVRRSLSEDGPWTIGKAGNKHYPIISLVNPELFSSADGQIHKKAVLANLVEILARADEEQLNEIQWLKRFLLAESKLDLDSKDPLDILRAGAALRSLLGTENKMSDYIIGHILKDESFKRKVPDSKKRHGGNEFASAFTDLITETGFSAGRYELAVRGVRDFRLQLELAQLLEGANLEQTAELLNTELFKIDALRPQLLEAVRGRIDKLVPTLTKVGDVARVLELVESFGLEIDPEKFGRTLRKSLTGSVNSRYLARGVSDEDLVTELEQKLEAASQVSAFQAQELVDKAEALSAAQAEIQRLKAASLSNRQQEEQMNLHDLKAARLPVIKAMARVLAAAHELLSDNPHSISRMEIIAEQVGLQNIGRIGNSIDFDLATCEDPTAAAQQGDLVEVQNVGYTWHDGAEEVLILKAVVISK